MWLHLITIAIDNDGETSINGATWQSRCVSNLPGTAPASQQRQHASNPPGGSAPTSQQWQRDSNPLGNSAPSLPVQLPENVVNIHCRCNHAPRLPSNSQLLAARQQQQALGTTGKTPNNGDGQDCPSVDLQVGPVTERSEPWQLQHYDPPTRDVIERVKLFSHCDAASIEPFPARATFNFKAIEYIDEAIAKHQSHGLIISDSESPRFRPRYPFNWLDFVRLVATASIRYL